MTNDPCRTVESVGADGERLTACAHGGHVTGWWPAGESASRLWMSERSGCGPGVAIRGGVPVIFPQFGTLGPLPKHGFVRDVPWTQRPLANAGGGPEAAALAFETTVGPEPEWPHEARVTLTARASGRSLDVALQVDNIGERDLTFTAALHTYFAVTEPGTVLHGLAGRAARDATDGGRSVTLPDGVPTTASMDLMVDDVGGAALVVRAPSGDALEITADGFCDRVVWNPGPEHALADVAAGDEAAFVCVEPAVLAPVVLAAGAQWAGVLHLRSGG